MSTTTLLLTMAACGLVTFLIRLSFIAFGRHLPSDPRFTAALTIDAAQGWEAAADLAHRAITAELPPGMVR